VRLEQNLLKQVVLALCLLAAGGCNRANLEPTPAAVTRPPQTLRPPIELKEVEGSGGATRQATIFTHSLPGNGASLDIRSVIVRPVENVVLVAEHEGIMELRSGQIETTIDGEKRTRNTGDMWQVQEGSRQNIHVKGELAAPNSNSPAAQ
jgi:hypothetical protein